MLSILLPIIILLVVIAIPFVVNLLTRSSGRRGSTSPDDEGYRDVNLFSVLLFVACIGIALFIGIFVFVFAMVMGHSGGPVVFYLMIFGYLGLVGYILHFLFPKIFKLIKD